ncbi:MAG: ABC transporter permease [Hyphomicrobium sp.]
MSKSTLLTCLLGAGIALALLATVMVHGGDFAGAGVVIAIAAWLVLWLACSIWSGVPQNAGGWFGRIRDVGIMLTFGITLIFLWEILCIGFGVPAVLLPAPSLIGARVASSYPLIAGDFVQTVIRAAIPGWAIGSLAGFLTALLCDRCDFLRRGLLPIGNLVSALPMIGLAPILVMWFGFDWQSKAAMVVVMTFFPMLVNTIAGLGEAGAIERDLMRSYGASWSETLLALRLPAAMPMIFNALKINSTLALIGAIVAEFFGTPLVGLGFRISTEVGRMALDTVWACIAVAAVTGSAFYGVLVLAERRVTFWHPSIRQRTQ